MSAVIFATNCQAWEGSRKLKKMMTLVFHSVLGFLFFHEFARGATATAGFSRECDLNALATLPAIQSTQVQYLYCLLLGRTADPNGLTFYAGQLRQKQFTVNELMDIVFRSAAFNSEYSNNTLTPAQFITLLYNLLLLPLPIWLRLKHCR
jgi:hypothetical protein